MILTVVGSGTAIPRKTRGSPCIHLGVVDSNVVFDLGSGSVRQLWIRGVDVREIDVLALTHFHPDHTADLVPLLFALGNPAFNTFGRRMTLLGPRGLKGLMRKLGEIYGDWIRPPGLDLEVKEISRGSADFGSWRLKGALTGHTSESVAFRVEEDAGSSLVYGGDSPYSEELILLAEGADLLILECSMAENAPCEGHLVPSQAAELAARAGARRLLLTHFYPSADSSDILTPARRHFDGEIILASDGLRVEV